MLEFTNQALYLDEMEWADESYVDYPAQRHSPPAGQNIIIVDYDNISHSFSRGVSVFNDSTITLKLNGEYERFTGYIGERGLIQGRGGARFICRVVGDGIELFHSGDKFAGELDYLDIDIKGVKVLQLIIDDQWTGMSGYEYVYYWAEATFYKELHST